MGGVGVVLGALAPPGMLFSISGEAPALGTAPGATEGIVGMPSGPMLAPPRVTLALPGIGGTGIPAAVILARWVAAWVLA